MTKKITISWTVLTILSLIVALIFMFPLYWAAVTSLKQETEVIDPNWSIFPRILSLAAYLDVLTKSAIGPVLFYNTNLSEDDIIHNYRLHANRYGLT